ncbi:MAG: bifunctional 3-(3-hydroxy-phenyl)propionate/3-hydroxycinnamic acid hydroxylase [Burkholderiales bacterium]|nr:bifunctional 3-(3-hydroxy-phenyl)propionate/3-hydroxycinnamic acid hydroxylase [Burkholderiales bacterium]
MPEIVDVAIVGFGPVGAALANLLGQAGLSVAVFEREAAIYPLPRAIHFDGEVMRVFHAMGLRDAVESVSRPGDKPMRFVNASGRTLLVRGGTSLDGPHGCANNHYFHQPELEAMLREGVKRFPAVRVHRRHEVRAIEPRGDAVRVTVDNLADQCQVELDARYVVGCDGARSLVRRTMGSPMEDLGLHQPWLVFDALLKRDASLPDHTVQYCNPSRPATYCNVIGNRRRWEIMLMPGDDEAAIAKPESVWQLVSRWISPADADIERAVVYTFHSVIARGWRAGRLLLAGDSAHQTPPFLGQGLCAGIRDAANLAWKLALVLRGAADDRLLDTYESERSPHVREFIALAVRLGEVIQTTDPAVAAERDRKFDAGAPEIFEFPAPGLGPGVHTGGGTPVGQPFPQPMLADGRRLDAAVGDGFALIATRACLAAVDGATDARLAAAGVTRLDDTHPALAAWLADHDSAAVLIRPDRYIAGRAADGAGVAALAALLPQRGTPAHTHGAASA